MTSENTPSSPHSSTSLPTDNYGETPFVFSGLGNDKPQTTDGPFIPLAPQTLAEAGIRDVDIEALLLKSLFILGAATGQALTKQIKLSSALVRSTLDKLRAELLITLKGATETGDFLYQLTEVGGQRASHYAMHTSYCGAAPVPMEDYVQSVGFQSVSRAPIELRKFHAALDDLTLPADTLSRLAQAVNAGRGLFLYGPPGNGKTSVAERVTDSYPAPLWIPRAITVAGEIIRLFDSSVHQQMTVEEAGLELDVDWETVDRRWVLIRRPTIVVGGELTVDQLDLSPSQTTGVFEAPIQMKANGGTLVIDDFGRQRSSPEEILNRWIVTLEKRADFLTLPNGRQIKVPFDEHLILATNLEPKDVVDEAYLRRIPFKIELRDPDEQTFRDLFRKVCGKFAVEYDEAIVSYLIKTYYKPNRISFRYCHPRDLVFQVANLCELHKLPRKLTRETIDVAVSNYFCEFFDK